MNNQPFLKNVEFPLLSNGNHDFTYMSMDCFHLSQKGYARGKIPLHQYRYYFALTNDVQITAANALWNNMMQPDGQKSTNWKKEFTEFVCPTVDRPYIATKKNS